MPSFVVYCKPKAEKNQALSQKVYIQLTKYPKWDTFRQEKKKKGEKIFPKRCDRFSAVFAQHPLWEVLVKAPPPEKLAPGFAEARSSRGRRRSEALSLILSFTLRQKESMIKPRLAETPRLRAVGELDKMEFCLYFSRNHLKRRSFLGLKPSHPWLGLSFISSK